MAKKGNTIAEFRREEHVDGDANVDIRRKFYAVREDGTVLVKNSVHFRESGWHDWGWQLAHHQRRSNNTSAASVIAQISPQLLSKGFERTKLSRANTRS